MRVVLYTTATCVRCPGVKRAMVKAGIPHGVIDLADDPDAYQLVTGELGYGSAPVTVVFDEAGHVEDHWGGFRPSKIDEYGLKF